MRIPDQDSFDCRATAALLRSGSSAAMAGHVAALMNVLFLGGASWVKWGAIAIWCAMVYLAVRVKIDAGLFELLAEHPADRLDGWLGQAGLRGTAGPRPIPERRRGAMKLWRALLLAVGVEMALAVFRLVG